MSQAKVIPVVFQSHQPATMTDVKKVVALAEKAAELLRAVGYIVTVKRVMTRTASATVEDTYRLIVTVGIYSSLGLRPWTEDVATWREKQRQAAVEIRVDVTADVEWLKDQTIATFGHFGAEYANVDVATVEEAVAWVGKHCRDRPVERVTAKELRIWEGTMVRVENAPMTLLAAVRRFGPLFGHKINAVQLIEDFEVSAKNAQEIVRAVRKILPKHT